jgi:rRNA pseudouridine-1189 N-methylase Emg1 (Nep1/Mra1 family)
MLVNALKPDEVIVLSPSGEEMDLARKFADSKAERVVVIIGGFPKGDFKSDLSKLKPTKVSFGPRIQKVWTVTSKVICAIQCSARLPEVTAPKPAKPRRAPKKKAE